VFARFSPRLGAGKSSESMAGAVAFFPPIDTDEGGGQCRGGGGIGERSAVDATRSRRIRQFDHYLPRLSVVAEHEHVAIDRPAGFELGSADIVERGLGASSAGEQPLRAKGGRAVGWELLHGALRWNQRHYGHDSA